MRVDDINTSAGVNDTTTAALLESVPTAAEVLVRLADTLVENLKKVPSEQERTD